MNQASSSALTEKKTAFEGIYYLMQDKPSQVSQLVLDDIRAHAKHISVLGPQIYSLDRQGVLSGSIDPRLVSLAKEFGIKLMPLVTNGAFEQDNFHAMLHNEAAKKSAIAAMVRLCEQNGFWGLQCDFENVHVDDQDALTDFFQALASELQQKKFTASIAIVPRTADPIHDDYDQWLFDHWAGVYDYKALAAAADFVSVMCYDRHTRLTAPGPIAPFDWVEQVVAYAEPLVPREKFSLGIPFYSGYYFSGIWGAELQPEIYRYRSMMRQVSYSEVSEKLAKFQPTVTWDQKWKSHYTIYTNYTKNEYLFIEDAASFQARLSLAKRHGMRGISVWKLGQEDPKVWDQLDTNVS